MLEANVVCVNHKKYMVEPFVVHVIFVVYMNHVCLDHVVFVVKLLFLHESNFSILFYTNQIPPLRILRSAGCTTGRGLTCEPLPVNPHP